MNIAYSNPPFLPPKIDATKSIDLLIQAHESIGRYDEAINRFINPQLIEPILRRNEAKASSEIEGTRISLSEILERDVYSENSLERNEIERDYKEVSNYREALRVGEEKIKDKQTINADFIKELHAILLNSVRGEDKSPGMFRSNAVFIGQHIPPHHEDINKFMDNMFDYLHNNNSEISELVKIAIFHYQFEAIHPFRDGNGRTGRILIPLYLYTTNLIQKPNLYISNFLLENRLTYFHCLHMINVNQEWGNWINFFLAGVIEQTRHDIRYIEQLEEFYERQSDKVLNVLKSRYSKEIVDLLFQFPLLTTKHIYKVLILEVIRLL